MKKFAAGFIVFLSYVQTLVSEDPGISESLFSHISDSTNLQILPFLPPVKLPFGMTVDILMMLLASALIFTFFKYAARPHTLKPRGLTAVVETVVLFVRDDIVYPVMGKDRGEKWLPFFTTLFAFILLSNFLGLIPAFRTATGNITITTALALMILFLIFTAGIRTAGPVNFLKEMYPEGANPVIGVFVAFLELIGLFVRSFVLSIRLFANMFAGHLAILSFLSLMFILTPLMAFVSVPFALFTYLLELLIAFIQALVFTLLGCIFIAMASGGHRNSES